MSDAGQAFDIEHVREMETLGVLLCDAHDVAAPILFRPGKATRAF